MQYGLNRDKEAQEQHHRVLFYDMGHSSTTAEIVEFKKGEDHKKNKTVPIIQLLGLFVCLFYVDRGISPVFLFFKGILYFSTRLSHTESQDTGGMKTLEAVILT